MCSRLSKQHSEPFLLITWCVRIPNFSRAVKSEDAPETWSPSAGNVESLFAEIVLQSRLAIGV
jgi:hypothetical protein